MVADALVYVVDDDESVRLALSSLLRASGYAVQTYASPADFFAAAREDRPSCLVLDLSLPGPNGLEVQAELNARASSLPIVFVSGHGDIPASVRGMKAGAIDFLVKPFKDDDLLAAIETGLARDRARRASQDETDALRARYATLTPREREVMALVTAGRMNKQVAHALSLSEITVKIHRGNAMRKMAARSLADLVKMAGALGLADPR